MPNKNNLDIKNLVEKILNSKDKNEINDLGKEIDQNIYKLYKIDNKLISIIENFPSTS